MSFNLFALTFLFLISNNSRANTNAVPPNPFIDRGACPFECCKYQKWTVIKETSIFDKIDGKRKVGALKKGSVVEALTGEVHVEPNPVEVVFDKGRFSKGDSLYLLTPQGEGFYKIWHNGKVDSMEVLELFENSGLPKACKSPSISCWGRPRKSMMDQRRVWWVELKPVDGQVGWSNESENFSNNDSCS